MTVEMQGASPAEGELEESQAASEPSAEPSCYSSFSQFKECLADAWDTFSGNKFNREIEQLKSLTANGELILARSDRTLRDFTAPGRGHAALRQILGNAPEGSPGHALLQEVNAEIAKDSSVAGPIRERLYTLLFAPENRDILNEAIDSGDGVRVAMDMRTAADEDRRRLREISRIEDSME